MAQNWSRSQSGTLHSILRLPLWHIHPCGAIVKDWSMLLAPSGALYATMSHCRSGSTTHFSVFTHPDATVLQLCTVHCALCTVQCCYCTINETKGNSSNAGHSHNSRKTWCIDAYRHHCPWVYMKAVVLSDKAAQKQTNARIIKSWRQLYRWPCQSFHLHTDGLKCCKCCPVSFFFFRSLWLSDTLILVLILSNFYA